MQAKAVLIVGPSLMVYSGYRYCRAALQQNKPMAAINLGRTRADKDLTLKLEAHSNKVLNNIIDRLII